MMKKKVFVVSHTHWDREWYLRREEFLMMLVELVDQLLDILQGDPEYRVFMLDGQTIVLEDYLSVRPDREPLLKRLIGEGKILIGPWYMMPDEYLISAEGHVRNFLLGTKWCKRFGAQMPVGYLPDSFGHPSQMPQILRGLGLEQIVFWRGLGEDVSETELVWEGLDGSTVRGINMPFGYGMAACLPTEDEEFVERIGSIIGRLEPLTRTDSVLVMQGVDHVAPLARLPRLLNVARERFPHYEFIHGTLKEYIETLPTDIAYQKTRGELRSGYKAYLLGGTISTRMYLKQENFLRERELLAYAEPLQALSTLLTGRTYPNDVIAHAWKIYLQNMPHDSICGCSIDAVHDEMMIRYQDLAEVNAHLINKAFSSIAGKLEPKVSEADGTVLVFNPRSRPAVGSSVRVTVVYEKQLIRKVNYANSVLEENYPEFAKENPTGVTAVFADGTEIEGRILSISATDEAMDLFLDRQPEMFLEKHILMELPVDRVPAVGIAAVGYRWSHDAVDGEPSPNLRVIENESIRVELDVNRRLLSIQDKRSGVPAAMLDLIDTADAGDEYTYSPPEFDRKVRWSIDSFSVTNDRCASTMVIEGYMDLPTSVTDDRKSRSETLCRCPLRMEITLGSHDDKAEVSLRFDNQAEDHQLSIELDTGISAEYSYAESHFGVDERPVGTIEDRQFEDWVEAPSTYAHKTFVAVREANGSVTVANRGIPAFEATRSEAGTTLLKLTLLRSVGWLSRYDLRSRKGNGGWSLRTPGAQCKGTHLYEFAIIMGTADEDLGDIAQAAHAYAFPLLAYPVVADGLTDALGTGSVSLVSSDCPAVVLSAIKRAEDGEGWIFRFYNTTDASVTANLSFLGDFVQAELTDLRELTIDEKPLIKGKTVTVGFVPWQVRTLRIGFGGSRC